MPLEPLPETREALAEVDRWTQGRVLAALVDAGKRVVDVVPTCVGLSLAVFDAGITVTLAATSAEVAALDAVQYAMGGPCVDAVTEDAVTTSGNRDRGLLDEERWAGFARAGAARGVLSTLSMPVRDRGRVTGSVNVYASTPNAFERHHEELAAIMGAWAPGAVRNADLSFSTREVARAAPEVLRERAVVDQATGVVMAKHGVDEQEARDILADAARRARCTLVEAAAALVGQTVDDGSPR
jgi:GAF domain-containing protein